MITEYEERTNFSVSLSDCRCPSGTWRDAEILSVADEGEYQSFSYRTDGNEYVSKTRVATSVVSSDFVAVCGQCPNPATCLGDVAGVDRGWGVQSCGNGTEGVLCGVCSGDLYGSAGSCLDCPDKLQWLWWILLVGIAAPAAYFFSKMVINIDNIIPIGTLKIVYASFLVIRLLSCFCPAMFFLGDFFLQQNILCQPKPCCLHRRPSGPPDFLQRHVGMGKHFHPGYFEDMQVPSGSGRELQGAGACLVYTSLRAHGCNDVRFVWFGLLYYQSGSP